MNLLRAFMAILVAGVMAPGSAPAEPTQLKGKVLFLLAEGFNSHEFKVPYEVLRAAGYQIDMAGPAKGMLREGRKGSPDAVVNLGLDEVRDISGYAGLVIPGGFSPGNLEKHPAALEICRRFMEAEAPVGAVCHGPRLLMKAGLMKSRVGTSLLSLPDELADAWKKREYGKYLDQPVVLDGNLLTAPHYCYLYPFCRAMIKLFAGSGGIAVAQQPAHVLLIPAGAALPEHGRWAIKEIPKILWTRVTRLDNPSAQLQLDLDSVTAMLVLPGKNLGNIMEAAAFKELIAGLQERKAPIIGVNAAAETLKSAGVQCIAEKAREGSYAEYVRLIVKRTQQSGAGSAAVGEEPEYTAAISLASGFDDKAYAALRTYLEFRSNSVAVAGEKPGWVTGRDGYPVQVDSDPAAAREQVRYLFAVTADGVTANKTDGEAGPEAVAFAKGATALPGKPPYGAVIALREGFDGYAYAALRAYLAAKDVSVAVAGPEKGSLRGLNGIPATVTHTYADKISLQAKALVIAPGGLWPEKGPARQAEQPAWMEQQAERDARRLTWIVDAYQAGAILVTVGFDGFRIARDEAFKGAQFAASGQAGGKFRQLPGRRSGEPALKGGERLYSASGPASLGALLGLLDKDGVLGKPKR